jgi:hypothetical protein
MMMPPSPQLRISARCFPDDIGVGRHIPHQHIVRPAQFDDLELVYDLIGSVMMSNCTGRGAEHNLIGCWENILHPAAHAELDIASVTQPVSSSENTLSLSSFVMVSDLLLPIALFHNPGMNVVKNGTYATSAALHRHKQRE